MLMAGTKLEKKESVAPIRYPSQQRSRDRQEMILKIAASKIAVTGSDALKMSEIATAANISIGSLYQYFPDKSAIIRTLAERYNTESRICISDAFANVRDTDSLQQAYLDLVDQYYALVLNEPVMRDIWSGMQADKVLMARELEESRLCGELLAQAMVRAHGPAVAERASTTALLVWQLGEAAVRLAISLDKISSQTVIDTFKRMTLREVMNP
jgi:AcrR family transcriptional regulator